MKTHSPVIERQEKHSKKYIPALAFLLAIPAPIASAFLVQGESSDFAKLNQFVEGVFFQQAYADDFQARDLVKVLIPDANAGISFQNDQEWTNQDGTYTVSDDDSDDSC